MHALGFILIGLWSVLSSQPAAQTSPCPAEVTDTRKLVERLLTHPGHESSRQETGLVGVPASSVRRLTSGGDDAACRALNAEMASQTGQAGPWRWTYYTAGNRYFVAAQYVSAPGTRRVGFVPVYVFDPSFRLLEAYAM